MSKEVIRPSQFGKADPILEEEIILGEEELKELTQLYENATSRFRAGGLSIGKVIKKDSDGLVVDINYKSTGTIPMYEFSQHELNKIHEGDEIEVFIDELENVDGYLSVSYERAKAMRAWDDIMAKFDKGEAVEGTVTGRVKGGLSVDIGIPAFLPGSQVDLQRVNDFDIYVGQVVTANVIKINRKRGNVIISRRKYLNDKRLESRKKLLETLEEGAVVQGTVKNITNYGAFVDIGGVDGLLHITDMTWGRVSHPTEVVNIGDQITVKIIALDKNNAKISLSIKDLESNPWENLGEAIQAGAICKGRVSSITDYGLFVELKPGVEGLVHISEISWTNRVNDLSKRYQVGDEVEVLVSSIDPENRRMSLSVKQLAKNPWEEVDEKFSVGQQIEGPISNIVDFGIFVQLMPGIDGLVHISDISWTEHVTNLNELYKKGALVKTIILGLDTQNRKISLGIKQLMRDPWEEIEKSYPVGTIIEGIISKLTKFGAFVRLPSGVEGLVHISEMGLGETASIEDLLNVGDKRSFRVIRVSSEDRKLGLTTRLEGRVESQSSAPRRTVRSQTSAPQEPRSRAPRDQTSRARTSERPVRQAPTMRSSLQLELEKHAKRLNKAEEAENTEKSVGSETPTKEADEANNSDT